MRYLFEECLERGKIITIPVDPALIKKELHEAAADLAAAERSLADHNEKWAIILAFIPSSIHSYQRYWGKDTVRKATVASSMQSKPCWSMREYWIQKFLSIFLLPWIFVKVPITGVFIRWIQLESRLRLREKYLKQSRSEIIVSGHASDFPLPLERITPPCNPLSGPDLSSYTK